MEQNLARWAMLAKALHLSEHEPLDVIIALKVALLQQKRLLLAKTEKHGNSNCVVDNRAIWVCAIVEGLGSVHTNVVTAFQKLFPLFAAFFALEPATNSAERGLGRHARHRDAHTGARETGISWSEVTFEVHEDGPSDEREIAIHCAESPGDLLMTDFSRQCARLWKALHGRRFCSYKERKDKGKIAAASWMRHGPMNKFIMEGHRRALKDLGGSTFHNKETVFGKKRTDIVKDDVGGLL